MDSLGLLYFFTLVFWTLPDSSGRGRLSFLPLYSQKKKYFVLSIASGKVKLKKID